MIGSINASFANNIDSFTDSSHPVVKIESNSDACNFTPSVLCFFPILSSKYSFNRVLPSCKKYSQISLVPPLISTAFSTICKIVSSAFRFVSSPAKSSSRSSPSFFFFLGIVKNRSIKQSTSILIPSFSLKQFNS